MILRIARHTNNLKALIDFYCQILNLEVLGSFENHNNYDGVFLGKLNMNWHLEFTKSDVAVDHHFDEDDILVFYPLDKLAYKSILSNIELKKIEKEIPINPYWKVHGIQISDPDGYKIIICAQKLKDQ